MITPVNGHLLIEPLVHESFVSSQKETFEEIGVVIDIDSALVRKKNLPMGVGPTGPSTDGRGNLIVPGEGPDGIQVGDKVYFDSWLAARYPKNENEYYWLVKWSDVRAVEHA